MTDPEPQAPTKSASAASHPDPTTPDAGLHPPLHLCAIEGDGIGREVIPAALDVLRATGLAFCVERADAGWDCFQRCGAALPEETVARARTSDAVLFGAVSSPSYPVAGYSSAIVTLRQQLDLYANLRPTRSWSIAASRPGIDMLIVRENSEGLYVRRERSDGATAVAERLITRSGAARIARVACEWAMQRRRRLTIVHKANVLPETCGLFRQTALDVAAAYPALQVDELLVDTAAMQLVMRPERFDVVVTTNLFGDILSDEAAGLVGGLGLAPSANLGERHALFEPVHGSAPDIAGQGIANPTAAILAVAMLLDHFRQTEHAACVRAAVERVLCAGPRTPDLGGTATTAEVTAAIADRVSAWAPVGPTGAQ
ncbi:MAG: isocitrate/isopropylmalate dehydrogenase family protein [Anaerolineae bacterium]|nr:isocitrate/isopropylmalate dehydrogenase family protein [Anaerolineae bacterium]